MNSVASQSSSSGWLGASPLRAEIFGRLHQARAEIHLPIAVDGDARGERMRRIDQPLRQSEPVERRALRAAEAGRAGTAGVTLSR